MEEYPVTKVTFLRRKHEYADVYSYFFSSSEAIPFTAGSYVHVRLLSMPETVRRVREFSFASAPSDSEIQFGIDHSSGSEYQNALRTLHLGDVIEVFKIKSHMTWPSNAPHAVMIAGGIGITPFRSMLRDKDQKSLSTTTTLLHVSRDAFLYGEELSKLTSDYRTANREGLATELGSITTAYPNAHYYVAGSLRFIESVAQMLKDKMIVSIETDEFKGIID